MTDTTNDIDAMLAYLAAHSRFGFHSALTALVAERDALKRRVEKLESQNPSEGEILQAMMMNREAELRVTCSALAGIYSSPNGAGDPVRNGQIAAAAGKAALAALREGATYEK
jgi:cobalamin biosynthesis Mg chelatase CobN